VGPRVRLRIIDPQLAQEKRLGHSFRMSGSKSSILRPRRSGCADSALRAELGRVSQMSIEDRVKAALSMRKRFDWLRPAKEQRYSGEK